MRPLAPRWTPWTGLTSGDRGGVPPPLAIPLACISYLDHGLRVAAIVGAMSHSITVRVSGGQLEAVSEGEVPDGTYVIQGTTYGGVHELGITKLGTSGQLLAHATVRHTRGD